MSIESRSRQYGKVFDHWQIKEFLGSGSGGKTAVFRLTRMDSTRGTSALKVVNLIEERGDINALSDFRRKEYEAAREQCSRSAEQEVWLMDDLRGNTNIVDYLDHTFVDWSDETGFGRDLLIRMELLKDLRSELRNGRMFSEREVLKIGRDICVALIRCHRKNILHRDVKPENIFRNKDGDYKLGDFGVSRVLDACPGAVASTGIGTYEYWPAEQMTGSYDKRVDVYSLGLVLYELSNQNRLPFAASSYATGKEVSLRLSGTALPEPSEASPALARVILKACAFNPDERYQSAEEFLKALNWVIRSAQDVAKPNVPQAPAKQAKSHDDYATVLAKELGLPDSIFADDSYKTAPAKAGDVPFRTSPKAQSVRQIERSYRTKPAEQMPTLLGKRRKKEKHSLVVILSITALSLIVLGLGASLLLFGHKKVDPVDEQAGLAATTPSKANEANSEDEIKDNLQESLTIVLSEDDFKILDSYPHLKTLNLSGSTCYKTIQEYIANHPDVSVTYTVSLGNIEVENTETSISLIPDDFSYAVMLENLQYLPQLTSITFDNIELTGAEMATLRNAYPNLNVHYAVELFGQIIDLNATYLDLSSMNSTQVDEAAAKMGLLPKLNSVQLNSALSMNEVATLQNSNRAAEFRYTFQLFGQVLSTTDDEVIFKNQQIGNEGELQIRQAMEILDGCHRFVLDNCGIDSEILASIREDFRDGPKLVWRVYFGLDNRYNTLTDADTIRAVYNVTDDTCRSLKYCEEVKYMDIGHNDGLSDLSFVAEMPDLEILIASSSSVTELSGFENCKKLTWLELVSCTQLRNIDALSGCENLAYLNLCYTNVSDYSSLNDLPLKRFVCLEPKVSTEMQDSFTRNHADCRVVFQGYDNPWVPWRYDDNGKTFEAYYSNVVRKVFNYDELEKYMA